MNKRNKILAIIFNIFIIVFLIIVLKLTKSTENFSLEVISWVNNILFLISLYEIYKVKGTIFDYSTVFSIFFFLFSTGQVVLFSFGIDTSEMNVFRSSTIEEIINATLFFIISYQFYIIGIIAFTKKENKVDYQRIEKEKIISVIKIIATFMIIVSSYQYLYKMISHLRMSLLYGYGSLFEGTNSGNSVGIIEYLKYFFIPGWLLLLYAYKDNKKKSRIIESILLLIAFIQIFIGSRGAAIPILIILIFFIIKYKANINKKDIVKIGFVLLIILMLIPVFKNFRLLSNKDVGSLIQTMKESKQNNFIVETVEELGSTMYAFILTQRTVPLKQDFKYGESYMASVLMLIPSQLLGGVSFAEKAALDTWLQNITFLPYGPGFSIVSELYYNFGQIGTVMGFFIGALYSIVFNLKVKENEYNKVFTIFKIIFLYLNMLAGRYPFHSTLRHLFFIVIVPYLAIVLIYNHKFKNKEKKINE